MSLEFLAVPIVDAHPPPYSFRKLVQHREPDARGNLRQFCIQPGLPRNLVGPEAEVRRLAQPVDKVSVTTVYQPAFADPERLCGVEAEDDGAGKAGAEADAAT